MYLEISISLDTRVASNFHFKTLLVAENKNQRRYGIFGPQSNICHHTVKIV